jgi:hypothetical protein
MIGETVDEALIGLGFGQHRNRRQVGIPPDDVVFNLELVEAMYEGPAVEQRRDPCPPLVDQGHDQFGVFVENVNQCRIGIMPKVNALGLERI